MPIAEAPDGVTLHFEDVGSGPAMVFVHEFGGDHRSWEPQLRDLSRSFRCITYAARGFPPSDVPTSKDSYSQAIAVSDLIAVMDASGIDRAHLIGNSMGGFTVLHAARLHSDRVLSATVAGCGYGAHPDARESFMNESGRIADAIEQDGPEGFARWYAVGPARVQYQNKDPRGHAEHARILADHDVVGAALTMRNVQRLRPSLYDLRDELAQVEVPTLLIAGDEDDGVLDTVLMLKRTMPAAALTVLPRTGHLSNLEEPARFNRLVRDLAHSVETGTWRPRDHRSRSSSITGAPAD